MIDVHTARSRHQIRLLRVLVILVLVTISLARGADAAQCNGTCNRQAKSCSQTAKQVAKALKALCAVEGQGRKQCRQQVGQTVKRRLLACRAMKAVCRDCCERSQAPCGSWCGDRVVDADEQCEPPGGSTCANGSACRIDCRCSNPVLPPTCGDGVVDPTEQCDLGARNGAGDACCAADCRFAGAAVVCRPAAGACDAAELCTGVSDACPSDVVQPASTACADDGNPCTRDVCDGTGLTCQHPAGNAGTICRTSRGECDLAEVCVDGNPTCPTDARKPATTPCTPDASTCTDDACDGQSDVCQHTSNDTCHCGNGMLQAQLGEECDAGTANGSSGSCCTADCTFRAGGSTCRDAAGDCDVAETCSGSSAACPPNAFESSSHVCRPAAGDCDVAESCSGSGPVCPPDSLKSSSSVCRAVAGDCDVAETCSGSSPTCPTDTVKASGFICRTAAGDCDLAETCSGSSSACPPDITRSSGSVCRAAAGDCDVAEICPGSSPDCPPNVLKPSTTVCRTATGECDDEEKCPGTGPACPPDIKRSQGSTCSDDGNPCTVDECNGTSADCPHASGHAETICRTARGECDAAETCTGQSPSCPPDVRRSAGVSCTPDATSCTDDVCDGDTDVCQHPSNGSCPCGNGIVEPAAGEACDQGEANGAVGSCCTSTCTLRSMGQECRPVAGDCDIAEVCSGVSPSCPADTWKSSGIVCRTTAGDCDVTETCSGTGPDCAADGWKSSGAVCRPAAGDCDVVEACSGTGPICPADTLKSSGAICRVTAGDCDLAEICSGTNPACPADVWKSSGTACRAAGGDCDRPESCTGSGPACPADALKPSGTVCRTAAGDCDLAEICDGTSPACPADTSKPSGTVCRTAAGQCDLAETCPGTGPACPPDVFLSSFAVCRSAAGDCDGAENCTGSSADCPADAVRSSGFTCRASAGVCDVAELCNGSDAACPADTFLPSSTTCRSSAGICDPAEHCTGSTAGCPVNAFAPSTTVCRSAAGVCDVAETCTGSTATCPTDVFVSSSTVCRSAAGVCDVAESCSGSAAPCPPNAFAPSSAICRSAAGVCDVAESCTGSTAACPADAFVSSAIVCRSAAGVCDLAESCTGSSAACPPNAFASSSIVCRSAAGVCDVAESCTGSSATCPADAFAASSTVCRSAAGVCDVAETCTGSAAACPANVFASSSTSCRSAAGVCDVAETCTGSTATCPADAFAPSTTVCRSAAGACDVAETCTGSSATCPANAFASSSTVCRSAAGACDVAENCTGSIAACPPNTLRGAGTTCRAGSGDACDPAEVCSGSSPTCPADIVTPGGTQCRAAGACPPAEVCSGIAGAPCPVDACEPVEELLGCFALETGPGQQADLPDVWNLAVQAGVQVTLSADTVDAATAANLCFRVQCPGQGLLTADDDVPCAFPPPAGSCPREIFTPVASGTCQVTVGLCSSQCAYDGKARYELRAVGAVPTLASDDGVPVALASGTLTCGALGDRYQFQAAAGQEVVIKTDTVDVAGAASLCISGSCTNGERFDEYDTAPCTFGGATYACVEKHFVPPSAALCKVQVTACHGECAGPQASYRLEVAGTTALTSTGDNVALGTCGNGQAEAMEVCNEPGLPACPSGWTCSASACTCERTMPDLSGARPDLVRQTLQNLGIRLGTMTPLVAETNPPASVQTQSVAASSQIRSGDAVDLLVSRPPDTGDFLTHRGQVLATEASALAYYDQIDPCGQRTTLDAWLHENKFDLNDTNEASAIYENHNDLGFGRRMHVRTNAADAIAYYVQNFHTVDEAWQHPERILATVAMEYSRPIVRNGNTCATDSNQSPFIKFFTFDADGDRITKVDLDGRGDKHQPEMCTVCHGGFAQLAPGNGGNIFASFIPFDLESFEYSKLNPLLGRTSQESAFKELNRAVIAGTSSTSSAAKDLVCGWYGGCGLPNATANTAFVPPSWTIAQSYVDAYNGIVKTGCRGCHAQLSFDLAVPITFSGTEEDYVCGQGLMPLARRTFENFWLGLPGRPYPPIAMNEAIGGGEYCLTLGPHIMPIVSGIRPSNAADGIGGPRAVAVDDAGTVYVSGFTSSKVLKLVPGTGGAADTATVIVDTTGGGVAPLVNATGIAVDHDRNVYVAGYTSDNVLRVTPQGIITKVLDATGDGVHAFDGPFGDSIGVDDAGNLYAAAIMSHNVFKRTPAGQITQIVGPAGDGQHPLTGPFALAVAGDGTTYVGGRNSNNVLRVDPDGTITQIIDQSGDGQGHLLQDPFALAVGRQGSVVVAGLASKTAFRIRPDGVIRYLSNVSITDTSLGLGATVDESDNVYVSIRAEHNVYEVTPGGTLAHLFHMNSAGGQAGPYDMAVDPRTRILWIAAREKTGVVSIDFGQP
jgi:hypothetical protein